jgi:3-isopropylmalate dehydrogenase
MFQPCHGTAPDIAGTGRANPTAMFLSAAMMLEWLGERHSNERLSEGARLLEDTVRTVFAERRVRPFELGGSDGTREITQAVLNSVTRSS